MVTKIRIGSFYLNGEAVKPGVEYNNETLVIGDSAPGRKIAWVEVNGLLIADRCLCMTISWNQLNELGPVCGTPVTVDGQKYLCRLLKVGDQEGAPNEWDNALDATSDEDELWHWEGHFFWGQDTSKGDASRCTVRGALLARYWGTSYLMYRSEKFGFRPVLEPLLLATPVSDSLLGTRLKVYLQKGCLTGVLTEYTAYDLVLQTSSSDVNAQFPGTAWVGNNLLIIDRKVVKYVSTRSEK